MEQVTREDRQGEFVDGRIYHYSDLENKTSGRLSLEDLEEKVLRVDFDIASDTQLDVFTRDDLNPTAGFGLIRLIRPGRDIGAMLRVLPGVQKTLYFSERINL